MNSVLDAANQINTMKKNKITFVNGDDWEGLYINGKLIMENHCLDVFRVLNAIGIDYNFLDADVEWLVNLGRLPENLTDVKEAKE